MSNYYLILIILSNCHWECSIDDDGLSPFSNTIGCTTAYIITLFLTFTMPLENV